jgi:hypothetical protein
VQSTLHSHRISVTRKIDRHCCGYRYFFASFSRRDGRPQKAAAWFCACMHRPAVDTFTTKGLLASSARGFFPPGACVRGRVAVGTHVGSCTVGGHAGESIVAPWASARPATTFLTSRACASNSHDGAGRAGGSAGLQLGCVGAPEETSNIASHLPAAHRSRREFVGRGTWPQHTCAPYLFGLKAEQRVDCAKTATRAGARGSSVDKKPQRKRVA